MENGLSRFNIASLVAGFAFLYLPIVLLIIYSFNESQLVTVWSGFSTKWYVELFSNQGLLDAAWVTFRVALISASVATVPSSWFSPAACCAARSNTRRVSASSSLRRRSAIRC